LRPVAEYGKRSPLIPTKDRTMNTSDPQKIEMVAAQLERQNRLLKRALFLSVVLWLSVVVFWCVADSGPMQVRAAQANEVLRVRGLIVVDEKGVERVRIGAPLPDPMMFGRRISRGGSVSGILLSDANGMERSGYVTDNDYGNVFFTLDSTTRGQHVLFVSDPNGGATLRMLDRGTNGINSLSLEASDDGPSFKLVKDGKTIFEQPTTAEEKK